jgi:hypothetical protein
MAPMRATSRLGGRLADAAVLFLTLATPFASYLAHHGFPLMRPATAILLIGLAAVACLLALLIALAPSLLRPAVYAIAVVLFVDFQFDVLDWRLSLAAGVFAAVVGLCWLLGAGCAPVFLAIFATMFCVTAAGGGASRAGSAAGAPSGARGTGPPILHVILDEHAGLAGIPLDVPGGAEARRMVAEFLSRNGFRFFSRAYSRFMNSEQSISSLLNFSASGAGGRKSSPSKYMSKLARDGYDVTVIQSTYMSLCPPAFEDAGTCITYDYQDLGLLDRWNISIGEGILFIAINYLNLSHLHARASPVYSPILAKLESAFDLPSRYVKNDRINSLAGFAALDETIERAAALRPGQALVAHILLPHFPYAFERGCDLRTPLWAWKSRGPWDLGRLAPNDPASRRLRYGEYADQLTCLYSRLEALLQAVDRAGMREGAVVVLHGDHGSRIMERVVEADMAAASEMRPQDFLDAFSTLFAVRMPGLRSGDDDRMLPIEELLRRTMEEPELLSKQADGDDEPAPSVRLRDRKSKSYEAVAIPIFPTIDEPARDRSAKH